MGFRGAILHQKVPKGTKWVPRDHIAPNELQWASGGTGEHSLDFPGLPRTYPDFPGLSQILHQMEFRVAILHQRGPKGPNGFQGAILHQMGFRGRQEAPGGLPWTFPDFPRTSPDFPGLPRTSPDFPGLSPDFPGLPRNEGTGPFLAQGPFEKWCWGAKSWESRGPKGPQGATM